MNISKLRNFRIFTKAAVEMLSTVQLAISFWYSLRDLWNEMLVLWNDRLPSFTVFLKLFNQCIFERPDCDVNCQTKCEWTWRDKSLCPCRSQENSIIFYACQAQIIMAFIGPQYFVTRVFSSFIYFQVREESWNPQRTLFLFNGKLSKYLKFFKTVYSDARL